MLLNCQQFGQGGLSNSCCGFWLQHARTYDSRPRRRRRLWKRGS